MMVSHAQPLHSPPSNYIQVHARNSSPSLIRQESKKAEENLSLAFDWESYVNSNKDQVSDKTKMNVCLHGHLHRSVDDRPNSFSLWESPRMKTLPNFSTYSPINVVGQYVKTVDQLEFSPSLDIFTEDTGATSSPRTKKSSSASTRDDAASNVNSISDGGAIINSHKHPSRTNSVLLLNSGWVGQNSYGESRESNDNASNVGVDDCMSKSNISRPRAFSVGASPEKCACGKKWTENVNGSVNISLLRSSSFDSNVDMEDMMTKHIEDWDENELVAELVEGTPKVMLSAYPQDDEDSAPLLMRKGKNDSTVCITCGSRKCLSVKPTLGYYKKEQVEKHCRPDDCWITAHGVVYDVTRYIAKHPGGAQSILRRAGQDCSHDFDFHSAHSRNKLWRRYRIGQLAHCTGNKATTDDNCVIC